MTEQLISFPVAKLAKEKGFKEFCYAYYDERRKLFFENKANGSSTDTYFEVNFEDLLENFNTYKFTYSAPTQSLLAKWLREKHNIHISCHPLKWNDNKIILYNAAIRDFNNKGEYYSVESINYESALELALEEGLKLIENIK